MAKPYKLRHVNEIAGTFVLVIVAVVVVAIFVMAHRQGWFIPTQLLVLKLPAESSVELDKSARVVIHGTVVGTVNQIYSPDPDSPTVLAAITVRKDFMKFVRSDSQVVLRRTLGFGDAYVEIMPTRQKSLPPPPPGFELDDVAAEGAPQELIERTINQVRDEVVPAVRELHTALTHVNVVAKGLEDGKGLAGKVLRDDALAEEVAKAVADLQGVVADVHKTSAALPGVAATANEELKRLPELVAQTEQMLTTVQAVLKDMQQTTTQLPETMKQANQTIQTLPGLILQAQETMRQVQRLSEGMQRNALLSPGGAAEQAPERISPSRVGGGGQ